MATVGAGSPIQTIQYQAMPFQTMAYAPQILSQKHEAMQEQLDLLGAATPSNIPEDAMAQIQEYSANVDNVVKDLAKSGYSFDMRNKLSGLRKDYMDKVKPVEIYNQEAAKHADLKQKAALNPDLMVIENVPSYTDFRKGAKFGLNVASGSEYEKYGAAVAEQSSEPYSYIKNGMQVYGKRDRFHKNDGTPMSSEEIKEAITRGDSPDIMEIKKRMIADGITDPSNPSYDIALDRIVKGIMSNRQPFNMSKYTPPTIGNEGGSGGEGSLFEIGSKAEKALLNTANVEDFSDLDVIANKPLTKASKPEEVQMQQMAIRQRNRILNGLADSNPELYKKYNDLQNSKPELSQNTVDALKSIGLSMDEIEEAAIKFQTISQEYNTKTAVGKLFTLEAFDPKSAALNIAKESTPNIDWDNMDYKTKDLITKNLRKDIESYREWYDQFKPVDKELTKYLEAETPEVTEVGTRNSTAINEWKAIAQPSLKPEEVTLGDMTITDDKGNKEVIDGNKDRERALNLLFSGNIESVVLTEPGEDTKPGVRVSTRTKDGLITGTIGLNDANAMGIYRAFLQASKDQGPTAQRLWTSMVNYQLEGAFDRSGGIMQASRLTGEKPKDYSNSEVEDLLNTNIIRTPEGRYIFEDNRFNIVSTDGKPGFTSPEAINRFIQQYINNYKRSTGRNL